MASSKSFSLAAVFSLMSLAAAQQCDLQFDGRVPGAFGVQSFDAQNNIFSPANVFGQSKRDAGVQTVGRGANILQTSSSAKSSNYRPSQPLW